MLCLRCVLIRIRSFVVSAFVFVLRYVIVVCCVRRQGAAEAILVGLPALAEEHDEVDWRSPSWSLGDVPRNVSCVVVWLTFSLKKTIPAEKPSWPCVPAVPSRLRRRLRFLRLQSRRGFFQASDWADDDDELLVRASAVLKSQGPENLPRGRPGKPKTGLAATQNYP